MLQAPTSFTYQPHASSWREHPYRTHFACGQAIRSLSIIFVLVSARVCVGALRYRARRCGGDRAPPRYRRRRRERITPIAGTIAYLRDGGIVTFHQTTALHFHPQCYFVPDDNGPAESWPRCLPRSSTSTALSPAPTEPGSRVTATATRSSTRLGTPWATRSRATI